jgi:hypothetical protein
MDQRFDMYEPGVPSWLVTADVTNVIHRLQGFESASLVEWTGDLLKGGGGECLGVWRLTGTATVGGTCRPWSIILKGWAKPDEDCLPSSFNSPHREMEMYRSGLLNQLPGGIRAPRCFGNIEREDGSVWVWLEDIADADQSRWPLARYGEVARQLGQFNGAYLTGHPLPANACLSRRWLRGWVEAAGPGVEAILDAADEPHVREAFSPPGLDEVARLWSGRDTAYTILDRLPQTFCHLDAFRRNTFIRQRPHEPDETILIDWSFSGIAAIGEELSALVGGSVCFMEVSASDAVELQELALESYIEGLRDAGWYGDAALARAGYDASVSLRYFIGPMRVFSLFVLNRQPLLMLEELFGRPIEEITAHLFAVNEWLAGIPQWGRRRVP